MKLQNPETSLTAGSFIFPLSDLAQPASKQETISAGDLFMNTFYFPFFWFAILQLKRLLQLKNYSLKYGC